MSLTEKPARKWYQKKRYIIPIVIATALLLAVFLVAGAIGSISTSNSQKTGEIVNSTTSTIELSEAYKIGDIVKVGDYTFTLNNFTDNVASGNQFIAPKAGNRFIKVNLTIENNSKEKTTISSLLQMYLKDGEGTKYQQTFLPSQKQVDGELLAGDKIKGDLVYEVPKTASDFKFYYNASWLTGQSIVIDLEV